MSRYWRPWPKEFISQTACQYDRGRMVRRRNALYVGLRPRTMAKGKEPGNREGMDGLVSGAKQTTSRESRGLESSTVGSQFLLSSAQADKTNSRKKTDGVWSFIPWLSFCEVQFSDRLSESRVRTWCVQCSDVWGSTCQGRWKDYWNDPTTDWRRLQFSFNMVIYVRTNRSHSRRPPEGA